MKFIKGKDLLFWSKIDFDCIFGKRQSKKIFEGDVSFFILDENEIMIISVFIIQEYFVKWMVVLKNKFQVFVLGFDIFEMQVECKRGKKRNKEVIGEDVESYFQFKVKRYMEGKFKRVKVQE